MSNIEINSEWTAEGYDTLVKVIVRGTFIDYDGEPAVSYENIWHSKPVTYGGCLERTFLLNHRPIEPFFEVGKTYGFKMTDGS